MNQYNTHECDDAPLGDITMSRRGILRAGGITVGLAALLAACVEDASDAKPARVGDAPAPESLPEGTITDGVMFRTLSSLHYSIIGAHQIAKELGELTEEQAAAVDAFIVGHRAAIEALDETTVEAGAAVWTCGNPRFDRVIVNVLRDRIVGRPKQGTEEADVPATDNPNRDATAMVYAMESVGAATHQSLVPQLSKPEYRAATMIQADACARRAAAFALVINPDNRINTTLTENASVAEPSLTTMEETTTSLQNIGQQQEEGGGTGGSEAQESVSAPQTYYAVPSQFGILSAFQLAIGAPSSGNQFTLNIETPSINSFVYDYEDSCT